MKTDLFDYELPDELVARHPPSERDGGRLLLLDGARIEHRRVRDLPELVPEKALVVVNDSRVRRARLFGRRRPGGGRVELLFIESLEALADGRERWRALARASKPLRSETLIDAEGAELEVLRLVDGVFEIAVRASRTLDELLEASGHVPLPPYLGREDEPADATRYQTVYAARTSSVAAPTAGLHLTEALLTRLAARGVELARIELGVGLGTFRPVVHDDLDQHPMHEEHFAISTQAARALRDARAAGRPVVAIGTTVVRALESAVDSEGQVQAGSASTRLLIQPGFRFRVVDALLTNFHQPRSTLLALVSAFAGYAELRAAYAEALRERYRFLSYGDAMWIPRRSAC